MTKRIYITFRGKGESMEGRYTGSRKWLKYPEQFCGVCMGCHNGRVVVLNPPEPRPPAPPRAAPTKPLPEPTGPDETGVFTWLEFKFRPAPNRYRRMRKEHPKTNEQFDAETAAIIALQAQEFEMPDYEAIGMEISPFNWDEILVWRKKAA